MSGPQLVGVKELEAPGLAWIRQQKAPEGLRSVACKYKLVRFSSTDVCISFSRLLTPPQSSQPPGTANTASTRAAPHCRLRGHTLSHRAGVVEGSREIAVCALLLLSPFHRYFLSTYSARPWGSELTKPRAPCSQSFQLGRRYIYTGVGVP